ncbi:MAG: HrpE/YscL family type III secretion apparatus protein [Desulfovibrio sp.]|nr:HrpE/YscL family type III secretion apparatus protein [Desulfovibrio sp.]
MGNVFHALGDTLAPAPGTRILKAEEYAKLIEAHNLLAHAREEAQAIKEDAERVYQERHKEGYEDGLIEGRMEQAEKMLETGMQAVEYLQGLEQQIVDVVTSTVRKIIGDIDAKERIVGVVRTALDQVRGRQRVVIRVCPSDEPNVREALAPMLARVSSARGIELVADTHLSEGDCVLESEMGVVDASLSVQLAAIEHALHAKIGEG